MFSIEFLHRVRDYEINKISPYFQPGARILEIGGGTGYQAKLLADRGFAVTSIDAGTSNYGSSPNRVGKKWLKSV